MLFLLTDFPRKLKLEKFHGALITHFYVSQSSPPLQSCFKENAKIFAKSSITQENITTSRQDLLLFLLKAYAKKHSCAGDLWENTRSSFKACVHHFLSNFYFFTK